MSIFIENFFMQTAQKGLYLASELGLQCVPMSQAVLDFRDEVHRLTQVYKLTILF